MTDEFDPLTGDPLPKSNKIVASKPDDSAITADVLAKLGDMSKEELIALIRGLPCVPIAHALLTKDEKRERIKAKVYAVAMESTNEASILKAANDWLDREDGKAAQMETVTLNANITNTNLYGVSDAEMVDMARHYIEKMGRVLVVDN